MIQVSRADVKATLMVSATIPDLAELSANFRIKVGTLRYPIPVTILVSPNCGKSAPLGSKEEYIRCLKSYLENIYNYRRILWQLAQPAPPPPTDADIRERWDLAAKSIGITLSDWFDDDFKPLPQKRGTTNVKD